jgi:thiol-disulfide isomerase/thioredoxin
MKLIFLYSLLFPIFLKAQEVNLYFPYFAGKAWELLLPRAQSADTVLRGVIPPDGRVLIKLPEIHRQHKGMARWMLRGGGGIDIIINEENFSVECLSDTPSRDNIIYKGSIENDFLHDNHEAQDQLLSRYEAVRMVLSTYPTNSPLHKLALRERKLLEQQWQSFLSELAKSPLYAARFREIVNLTRGFGSSLEQTVAEKAADADYFISQKLSWEALYTSNHWAGIIYSWVQMHTLSIQDDDALMASANRILNRLDDPELYTSFCEYMTRFLIKEGKDSLIMALGPEILASGKLLRHDVFLTQFTALRPGDIAPNLFFPAGSSFDKFQRTYSSTLKIQELPDKHTLLVFYQSGCGPCENVLEQLKNEYQRLQQKGVRVIAMSADRDRLLFENIAATHPWPDKYCDVRGLDSQNFIRYAVAGTPTIFLLDSKGRIIARESNLNNLSGVWW